MVLAGPGGTEKLASLRVSYASTVIQYIRQDFCSDALLWNFLPLNHFLGCLCGMTFKTLAGGITALKLINSGVSKMGSYLPSFRNWFHLSTFLCSSQESRYIEIAALYPLPWEQTSLDL